MTLLQCSWLFLMCFSLGWRSYQQCNGNMLCFAPDMVINEYVAAAGALCSPSDEMSLVFGCHQCAGALVCLFVSPALEATVLSACRLCGVKQRLSAVVDSQSFIALIDSAIGFLNGAPRARGRLPGPRAEQAFFPLFVCSLNSEVKI